MIIGLAGAVTALIGWFGFHSCHRAVHRNRFIYRRDDYRMAKSKFQCEDIGHCHICNRKHSCGFIYFGTVVHRRNGCYSNI